MMFLHEKLNIGYIADLKVQILELPYAGEVSMFLLLPDGIAESSTGLELVRIPTSVVLNSGAKLAFAHVCCCCCYLVAKSRPTLWDPLDFSPPYSSVPGISQARLLEQVAISSPGDLPDPRIKPTSPALASGFFITESPGKLLHMPTIWGNGVQLEYVNLFETNCARFPSHSETLNTSHICYLLGKFLPNY